jgi:predicted permease
METGFYPDFFLPLSLQPQVIPSELGIAGSVLTSADQWWVPAMGRLKPGVNDTQALAELNVLFAQAIKATLPKEKNTNTPRIRFVDGNRGLDFLKALFAKPIYILLALVSLILLVACVNLANLLLARSAAREHEMGVRIALGAGRARILRQVFTECLLLASLGGTVGLVLGYCVRNLVPFLMSSSWENQPLNAAFDHRVVVFTLGMTFFSALLFGVIPAWRPTKADANNGLSNSRRMAKSFDKAILGRLLIVLRISLSVLLLIGAGLFTRTLVNLRSSGLGFNPAHILLFDIDLPRSYYAAEHRAQAYRDIETVLGQVPGVSSVSLSEVPVLANAESTTDVSLPKKPNTRQHTWMNWVGPDFFRTMSIPILYGRSFDDHDSQNSEPVVVINQRLAQKLFPNTNSIGRMIQSGGRIPNRGAVKVVGVSGDAKFSDLRTPPPPTSYLDYRQQKEMGNATFELKTFARPESLIPSLRNAVARVDKDLPLVGIRTENEQISATLAQEKTFSTLTTGFGLLALILASIGIYGIMAYNVARRVNEIGIRMALGAQSGQIRAMILREGVLLAIAGILLGVAATLPLTRLVATMLYGVSPTDPLTLIGATVILLAIALLAAFLPARKASVIDPTVALRHE